MRSEVLLPIATLILGAVLTFLGNLKIKDRKHRFDRQARQRLVLEQLQDAALELAEAQATMLAAWEEGTLNNAGASSEVASSVRRTLGIVQTLRSRVVDEDVRAACLLFTNT